MHATAPTYTPAPLTDRVTVLTPRGHVAAQIVRLGYELAELEGEDRAYIVAMLRELLDAATA